MTPWRGSVSRALSPGHIFSWELSLLGTQSLGTRSLGTQSPRHLISWHSVATPREVLAYVLTPTVFETYSHFLQVGCILISGEIFQGIFFALWKYVNRSNIADTTYLCRQHYWQPRLKNNLKIFSLTLKALKAWEHWPWHLYFGFKSA